MECSNCNSKISSESKFCMFCGDKVHKEAEPQALRTISEGIYYFGKDKDIPTGTWLLKCKKLDFNTSQISAPVWIYSEKNQNRRLVNPESMILFYGEKDRVTYRCYEKSMFFSKINVHIGDCFFIIGRRDYALLIMEGVEFEVLPPPFS